MGKMIIFVLLAAFLIGAAWLLIMATWKHIRRARDEDFQDKLDVTIKADAASDRLEAAEQRMLKREGK